MNAPLSILLSLSATAAVIADPCIPIQQQPANAITCPGGDAPFSVVASGPGPYSYQWQIETIPGMWIPIGEQAVPLGCGGNASHAVARPANSANTLIRTHGCDGPYSIRVIISSNCGSTTSSVATITNCAADFNCDNAADFFDYLDFVGEFSTGQWTADFNGDSSVDFFDYLHFVQAFSEGC